MIGSHTVCSWPVSSVTSKHHQNTKIQWQDPLGIKGSAALWNVIALLAYSLCHEQVSEIQNISFSFAIFIIFYSDNFHLHEAILQLFLHSNQHSSKQEQQQIRSAKCWKQLTRNTLQQNYNNWKLKNNHTVVFKQPPLIISIISLQPLWLQCIKVILIL